MMNKLCMGLTKKSAKISFLFSSILHKLFEVFLMYIVNILTDNVSLKVHGIL